MDDEKEFGPIASSRDDHHLIQVNFTKDIHDTEKLIQKKNEAYSQIAEKLLKRTVCQPCIAFIIFTFIYKFRESWSVG
mgnify:CR=1 FL=1